MRGTTRIKRVASAYGVDLTAVRRSIRGRRAHAAARSEFMAQAATSGGEFAIGPSYPCLGDRYEEGGVATGHYFHQDLHVAQQIHAAAPERHVDVGSRVDGFVAHVAAFRQIDVLDVRPTSASTPNITFHQRDLMEADERWDEATDSLSCLHTLEHMGLGRYGDPVDYYGYRTGWENLVRMVRPGGRFYFSVPIGEQQRVEFDGHRIFSIPFLLEMIATDFDVEAFAFVDDGGDLHVDVDPSSPTGQSTFGLSYGCGIFTLLRR